MRQVDPSDRDEVIADAGSPAGVVRLAQYEEPAALGGDRALRGARARLARSSGRLTGDPWSGWVAWGVREPRKCRSIFEREGTTAGSVLRARSAFNRPELRARMHGCGSSSSRPATPSPPSPRSKVTSTRCSIEASSVKSASTTWCSSIRATGTPSRPPATTTRSWSRGRRRWSPSASTGASAPRSGSRAWSRPRSRSWPSATGTSSWPKGSGARWGPTPWAARSARSRSTRATRSTVLRSMMRPTTGWVPCFGSAGLGWCPSRCRWFRTGSCHRRT